MGGRGNSKFNLWLPQVFQESQNWRVILDIQPTKHKFGPWTFSAAPLEQSVPGCVANVQNGKQITIPAWIPGRQSKPQMVPESWPSRLNNLTMDRMLKLVKTTLGKKDSQLNRPNCKIQPQGRPRESLLNCGPDGARVWNFRVWNFSGDGDCSFRCVATWQAHRKKETSDAIKKCQNFKS